MCHIAGACWTSVPAGADPIEPPSHRAVGQRLGIYPISILSPYYGFRWLSRISP